MPSRSNLARGIPQIPDRSVFQDFAPDIDSIMPGILLDCDGLYPTAKGFKSYPSLVRYSSNYLASACMGGFAGLQGISNVLLAGTASKLYEIADKTLTDSGLTPTTIVNPARWRFDSYGTDLIAVNGTDAPYVKPSGGSWGNLGGSPPVASIVQATDFAVFLITPNSNEWRASLADNIWTLSIATQTVKGNLYSTDGNITAAHALRSGIAMYKRKALHYGTWIGPPLYWNFPKVSDQVGAPGQEAVANIGDIHYFPGTDDFYSFDGQSLQRIPNNLKEWFFSELDQTRDFEIAARWDQQKSLIFWHFPTSNCAANTLDRWICLNIKNGRWSKGNTLIEFPIFTATQTGNLTYGSFTTTFPTYGDVGSLRYGDLQSRTTDVSGAFKTDHGFYLFNGAPDSTYCTSHDFGDRHNMWQVTRVRPQFAKYPASGATLQVYNQSRPGDTPVAGLSVALSSDGWFNFVNTARLQRFKITGASEMEITGLEAMVDYAGER